MFQKRKKNLSHITLYIPKPHDSLRVAHTISVQKTYINDIISSKMI